MKNKNKLFLIGAAVFILALIGFQVARTFKKRNAPQKQSAEVTLVKSAQVRRGDISDKVSFTGTIRPRNEVDVFTKLPGRIETLLVQVGDKVKAGQVIATVEHKEIAWQTKTANAAVRVAQANLDGAKLDYDRTKALFDGGSATQSQVDAASVRLALSEAQLAQAKASAGLSRENLANSTIVAPIDGSITRRPVNIGTNLGTQTVVVTIQDLATLKLEASVDPSTYARLKKGSPAEISVDAIPGETTAGKVSVLSPSLDSTSRRAAVEIEVDNSAGRLLPNMFARVEVITGRLSGALTMPRAALLESAGGATVFRLKDGHAEKVQPKLGPVDGDLVAVLDGLREGDEVAISGQANLADGAPAKAANSTASNSDLVQN